MLLAAPSSDALGGADAKWVPLLPAGPTESEQEAPRNVARRLRAHGLLDVALRPSSGEDAARFLLAVPALNVSPREVEWACRKRGREAVYRTRTTLWFVQRTPKGDDLVRDYRRELESARAEGPLLPIRWR